MSEDVPPTALSEDLPARPAAAGGLEASVARRKLENADSSYDSDPEPPEEVGVIPDARRATDEGDHDDVCRTVSDTLGVEFAEYVSSTNTNSVSELSISANVASSVSHSSSTTSSQVSPASSVSPPPPPFSAGGPQWVGSTPGYSAHVEFGIKLGYSEALVQQALTKLTATPAKDELLAELIRLGAAVRSDGTSDEGSEGDAVGDAPSESVPACVATETLTQASASSILLRPIIIDGSNVAMSHGNKTTFSCRGLRICVDWFRARGHREVTVFVPAWRKETSRWDTPILDQEVLMELEQERVLVFTPSRVCGGKRIVSYDDRYILKEVLACGGGVVVSNDNYRDLASENADFRRVVEENLLMYSWVNGRFVPPDDPLGRNGPTLDAFLRKPAQGTNGPTSRDPRQMPCPYGPRCTYGNKCKYMHPERGSTPLKSVTERLQEQAQKHFLARSREAGQGPDLRVHSLSLPITSTEGEVGGKKPLSRTRSSIPTVSVTSPPSGSLQEGGKGDSRGTVPLSSSFRTPTATGGYKSDSSLYPLFPPPSASGNSTNFVSATNQSWGLWCGPDQSLGARTQMLSPSGYSEHMPLGKQISDPTVSKEDANTHAPLQRQLTLNPSYDERLYRIAGFRSPPPEHFKLATSQHDVTTAHRQHDDNTFTYANFPPGSLHSPISRHPSSQEQHGSPAPPVSYSHSYAPHPLVTRFASDPVWSTAAPESNWPRLGVMKRLNSSSSETNLSGHEASFCGNDSVDDSFSRLGMYPQLGPPANPSGAGRTRPVSPQSSLMPHHSFSTPPPSSPHTPNSANVEDARLHLFYHLSQLFPEAQVRQVLSRHPDELDPQRICRYMLSPLSSPSSPSPHPPGPIGSRSISPQQPLRACSPIRGIGYHTPASPVGIGHEDARLRAFYHLSKVFPEARVRQAMAVCPQEVDPQKICQRLLADMTGCHL